MRRAAGATPWLSRVSAVWPAWPAMSAADVRAVAVGIAAVAAGEVLGEHHAAGQRGVPRVDARVDQGHADARAGERLQAADARPHLVGADAFRRQAARPDQRVGRQVVDVRSSLRQRVELARPSRRAPRPT